MSTCMQIQKRDNLHLALQKGLLDLKCALTLVQQEKLIQFIELLIQWNRVHNLTAISDPLEMISHHLLDSLSVLPYVEGNCLLDVGTGAGLPGIPLAIARPEIKIVLLDKSQKKIQFLHHVIATLQLPQVTAVHQRVEDYPKDTLFDVVISRAFSSLKQFVTVSGPRCHQSGTLIAMKGKVPEEELQALPLEYQVKQIHTVQVPGMMHRCLVFMKRNT